jgi:lysozyme|tara:strand:- start:2839 stop:3609 length:771 start_codon:yes stop_codon:yes gene_type:complete
MALYGKDQVIGVRERLGQTGFQDVRLQESGSLMRRSTAKSRAIGQDKFADIQYKQNQDLYGPVEKIKGWQEAGYEVSQSFKNSIASEYKVASAKQSDMLDGFPVPVVDAESDSVPVVDNFDSLVGLVAGFEGFSGVTYDDYKQESIGYGSKATNASQIVTEPQAKEMLVADLKAAEKAVNELADKHGYNFTAGQTLALASFTQNLGRSNLNKLFNNGKRNIKEISTMMLEYNRAGGKKLDGLVKRRAAEQKLFKGG